MTITASPKAMIFESPDRGNTVYAREIGSIERTLVRTPGQEVLEKAMKQNRFLRILETAETHPAMQDLLDQLEAIYVLVKENDDEEDH